MEPDLAALQAGDEAAFRALVRRHHAGMVRVARLHVASDATAEEVVQDAWIAVIAGLASFEGRSSLSTWMFSIVANLARRRGARDARQVPFSSFTSEVAATDDLVPAERFFGSGDEWPDHWATPPRRIDDLPPAQLERSEVRAMITSAIEALPAVQQRVMWLRDVEGLSAAEVCSILEITDGNQRVLLHRARARVRAMLEAQWERR